MSPFSSGSKRVVRSLKLSLNMLVDNIFYCIACKEESKEKFGTIKKIQSIGHGVQREKEEFLS